MTLQPDYPLKTIWAVVELPRSSFYHRAAESADGERRTALVELAAEYPT